MRHFKLFEEFNEENYRVITGIAHDVFNFKNGVLDDAFEFDNEEWIYLNNSVVIYKHVLEIFISPKNITFSEAREISREITKSDATSNAGGHIPSTDTAIVQMNTKNGKVEIVNAPGCKFKKIFMKDQMKIYKLLDLTTLAEKSPEELAILKKIFPKEIHDKRGMLSGKNFGF